MANGPLAGTLFCNSLRGEIASASILMSSYPGLTRVARFMQMTMRVR